MRSSYRVTLTSDERQVLTDLLAAGTSPARTQTHARILLKADRGAAGPTWTDARIAEAVETSPSTIHRVRQTFATSGLDAALHRRPPTGERPHKLDGAGEARLTALACSAPPAGRTRWTLALLADGLVNLAVVDHISAETVRTTLKKTVSSRG